MQDPTKLRKLAGEHTSLELLNALANLLNDGQVRVDDRVGERIQQGTRAMVERA